MSDQPSDQDNETWFHMTSYALLTHTRSGWVASARIDGRRLHGVGTTIHSAIRALREQAEGGAR